MKPKVDCGFETVSPTPRLTFCRSLVLDGSEGQTDSACDGPLANSVVACKARTGRR